MVGFKRGKTHKNKYLKQQKIIGQELKKIEVIKIMYIAPDFIAKKELKDSKCDFIDYKISFSELIKIKFDDDWEKIKKYLWELNSPSE